MKDPFVFKVLDVSTGHMTREDNEALGEKLKEIPAYELEEYGWLVYIGEIDDNWPNMSEAFRNVLKAALKLECDYVRFDRDGREYSELPIFNW